MPIANTVLTKTEFEYLQQNITDQYNVIASAGTMAETGLHYVVLLQVDAPEVDLIDPFALQVTRSESLSDPKYFLGAVSALNNHAITRSALAIATVGTQSAKLNAYFENNGDRILVTTEYAALTALTGITIDPCYVIDPVPTPTNCAPSLIGDGTAWVIGPAPAYVASVAGTAGVAFSYIMQAVGTLPIVYTITTAVGQTGIGAAGIAFDAVHTIAGANPVAGTYTLTLNATNGSGTTAKALTIVIAP